MTHQITTGAISGDLITIEAIFFLIVAKTRLERAVEIKTNGSTQNENNLKAQTSPDFRSTGAFVRKISMTTITFFVCDDDGLTTQTSVLMGIRR